MENMEKLLKELNDDIGELNQLIDKNSQDLKEYNQSEEKRNESRQFQKYNFNNNLEEFTAKSYLMIPTLLDDTGSRPIIRPLIAKRHFQNSSGLQILDNAGIPQNILKPNRDYLIEANITNRGDLYVPLANVEFFCSPKYEPNNVEFEIESYSFVLNTVSVKGKLKKGQLGVGDHMKIMGQDADFFVRINGIIIPYGTDHTISFSNQIVSLWLDYDKLKADFGHVVSNGDLMLDAPDYKPNELMFRFRVSEAKVLNVREISVSGIVEQGQYRQGENLNLFTGSRQGERSRNLYRISPSRIQRKHYSATVISSGNSASLIFEGVDVNKIRKGDILVKHEREEFTSTFAVSKEPESVSELEFLGTTTTYVDGLGSKKVQLAWHSPAKRDRRDYVFTARVYSTMPIDMPENFDDLSPKRDRHIAVKKIGWEG